MGANEYWKDTGRILEGTPFKIAEAGSHIHHMPAADLTSMMITEILSMMALANILFREFLATALLSYPYLAST